SFYMRYRRRNRGFALARYKQFFLLRSCPSRFGSIFCVLRWWLRCSCTTWSPPRSAAKLYGVKYITSWCHRTKHASLVAPPQAKAEHDHLLCYLPLQCDMRDVLLLG